MQIKQLHQDFKMPTRGSSAAGGYDIYMPTAGDYNIIHEDTHLMVGLGFSAKVPDGHVALILPRSGAGAKHGVSLRNTCGVIDADYTGEWFVAVTQTERTKLSWKAGDRLFQFIIVPVADVELSLVDELPKSARGEGGFGSTGA